MSNRLKKYGMMIIAVVLLVALAFAGAASAALTNVNDFSGLQTALTDGGEGAKLTGPITATAEITISGAKTLDLNGYTITISGAHRFATVGSGVVFTLTDSSAAKTGTITDGSVTGFGGGVYVGGGGTFTMNGGSIKDCSAGEKGGGVCVSSGGKFTMNGGSITGCSANYGGGGVYVGGGGTFTMNGGSISNCSGFNGGGVYVLGGMFTMTGGSIKDCSATGDGGMGGGVIVCEVGTFEMTGGSISGCKATGSSGKCGGVYVEGSTFTMNGGSISGCSPNSGGGVYVYKTNTSKKTSSVTISNGLFDTTTWNKADFGDVDELSFKATLNDGKTSPTMWMQWSSSSVAVAKCPFSAPAGKGFDYWKDTDGKKVDNPVTATSDPVYTAAWGDAVAKIKETSFTYATVNVAFTAADDRQTIELLKDSTLGGEITVSKTVMLDLNGKTLTAASGQRLFTVNGSGKTFTLTDSSAAKTGKLTGGSASISCGGVWINGGMFTMAGGSITGCNAGVNGGGVVVFNGGTFTMTGGIITGCNAGANGGGVYVDSGTFKVSGNAKVTGNTDKSTTPNANNVYLNGNNMLQLTGVFTGTISIANPVGEGNQFGTIASGVKYASGFVADTVGYTAYKDGSALKWKYTEYSITYDLDKGTNAPTNPATYNITTALITLDNATKTGYTFNDWYSDAAKTVVNNTIPTGSNGNKAFWAKFTANQTVVTFVDEASKIIVDTKTFTFDDDVTLPEVDEKDGYVYVWTDADKIAITDETYTKDGKWNYAGEEKTLTFSGNYVPTKEEKTTDASGKASISTPTALAGDASDVVDKIVFSSVSGLKPYTQVTFVGASDIPYVGQLSGYTKVCDLSSFKVDVAEESISGETATMQIAVTFKESSADKYKNNVRFVHCKDGKWETSPLASSIESTVGNVVIYKVETDSFSPFAISIQTKNSSGSHQGGSRILPATDAPTVTPTQQPTTDATPLTPTVKPSTQQPTQQSPAPLAGLVAGLGAVALFLVRMRK